MQKSQENIEWKKSRNESVHTALFMLHEVQEQAKSTHENSDWLWGWGKELPEKDMEKCSGGNKNSLYLIYHGYLLHLFSCTYTKLTELYTLTWGIV